MTTIADVNGRDALAAKIRHWYWGYVRAVGGISPDADDPEDHHHILYDGGADGWGRTRQPIWPELAQWVIDAYIDVQTLLRNLAELHQEQKCLTPYEIRHYPLSTLPRDLAEHRRQVMDDLFYRMDSERGVARTARNLLQRRVMEVRKEIVHNIGVGNPTEDKLWRLHLANMSDIEIYREVIINGSRDLSPLVRFLLAHQGRQDDLATDYWDQAIRQYLQHPDAYDQIFGNQLPDKFRAAARARLDRGT